jgi:hypothetical protein
VTDLFELQQELVYTAVALGDVGGAGSQHSAKSAFITSLLNSWATRFGEILRSISVVVKQLTLRLTW